MAPLALRVSATLACVTSLSTSHALAGDVLPVTSCADDGSPGTLRSVAASATRDATIDLSALTCSTITLVNGAIEPAGGVFTLRGPGMDRLTIDGNGNARILAGDVATIDGLTLTDGHVSGNDGAAGGCVYARIGVVLRASRVTGCVAEGVNFATGGGIFAGYYVDVINSIVSNNTASAPGGFAEGGGVSATYSRVSVERSTIEGNSAVGLQSRGGGVFSIGVSTAFYSTIVGNSAEMGGGWYSEGRGLYTSICIIGDSTISGNTAHGSGGGWLVDDTDVSVTSSTIVFNHAETGVVGGLFLKNVQAGFDGVGVDSSIIALNSAGDPGLSADFDTNSNDPPFAVGNDNLFSELGRMQPGHIIGDPMLGPLAANGGRTLTHALLPGSPAIDTGNNIGSTDTDQRGAARWAGEAPDIGAYEVQPDAIFANGFD
jgi:hypothetical protein